MKQLFQDNHAGAVEIITFRTIRTEHPYLESLMALLRGTSTGHIAMRITFNSTELFSRYIEHNKNIHYRINTNQSSGKKNYEVYVSFWPDGVWAPWHHSGIMQSYKYDCEQSGNYSPVEYNPKYVEYMQPLQKVIRSSLPGFKSLTPGNITLPPTFILHSSRLGIAFGDKETMIPNQDIVNAAESYMKKYHAWRTAVVAEQNAKILQPDASATLESLNRSTHLSKIRMNVSRKHLKMLMFPNDVLNDNEFQQELEKFITFGYPERDAITLPLVYDNAETVGIELEPILAQINKLALHPKLNPYNVLTNNCANIVMNMLLRGAQNSDNYALKSALILPWLIRWCKITMTPALVLQMAINVQHTLSNLQQKIIAKQYPTLEAKMIESHNANKPSVERKNDITALLDTSRTLEFSNHSDSDENEMPTTSAEICSKLARNVSEYIR